MRSVSLFVLLSVSLLPMFRSQIIIPANLLAMLNSNNNNNCGCGCSSSCPLRAYLINSGCNSGCGCSSGSSCSNFCSSSSCGCCSGSSSSCCTSQFRNNGRVPIGQVILFNNNPNGFFSSSGTGFGGYFAQGCVGYNPSYSYNNGYNNNCNFKYGRK